jgi:hypothetical protein
MVFGAQRKAYVIYKCTNDLHISSQVVRRGQMWPRTIRHCPSEIRVVLGPRTPNYFLLLLVPV